MGGSFGKMMARHARQISGCDWVANAPDSAAPQPQHRKVHRKVQAHAHELDRIKRCHEAAKVKALMDFRRQVISDAVLCKFVGNKTLRQVLHMAGVNI